MYSTSSLLLLFYYHWPWRKNIHGDFVVSREYFFAYFLCYRSSLNIKRTTLLRLIFSKTTRKYRDMSITQMAHQKSDRRSNNWIVHQQSYATRTIETVINGVKRVKIHQNYGHSERVRRPLRYPRAHQTQLVHRPTDFDDQCIQHDPPFVTVTVNTQKRLDLKQFLMRSRTKSR